MQESAIRFTTQSFPVADRSLSRVINQTAILEKIYQSEGISRAQLAKELGISKPAVASNVESLMEIGLVEERGEGEAAKNGGRKPVMLYFNSTHTYVGALDLSFLAPVCAIADLKHQIVGLKRIKLPTSATEDERRECIRDAFLEILEENEIPLSKLEMIMISQPGLIREDTGAYFTNPRHHFWTEIQVNRFLEQTLHVRVSVRNDVNLAAIGELNFGLDFDVADLMYISCGVGLGAGILIEKVLYSGKHNAAGEIASMILPSGQTLEEYIAMDGLVERVQTTMEDAALDFAAVVRLVKEKSPPVCAIVAEAGSILGRYIHNCCIMLDIETVIFGGDYLELGDTFCQPMEQQLRPTAAFTPRIIRSKLTRSAGIYGSFVLGKEKVLSSLVNQGLPEK